MLIMKRLRGKGQAQLLDESLQEPETGPVALGRHHNFPVSDSVLLVDHDTRRLSSGVVGIDLRLVLQAQFWVAS
jgi:hypothetical protein